MRTFLKTALATIFTFFTLNVGAYAHDDDIVITLLQETLQTLRAQTASTEEEVAEGLTEEACQFFFAGGIDLSAITSLASIVGPCIKAEVKTTVIISGPGGDPSAAAMFYDLVDFYGDRALLTTIGMGDIHSATVIMLLSGGTRLIGQHASILVHQGHSNLEAGRASDRDIYELQIMDKSGDMIYAQIIADVTNLSLEEANKYIDESTIFTADEAVKYGFADKILGDK